MREPTPDDEAETRAIAAMEFEAEPVDWTAFSGESWAERSAQEGALQLDEGDAA